MPISEFDGYTFVAFLDISGFKELMKQGNRALKLSINFTKLVMMFSRRTEAGGR